MSFWIRLVAGLCVVIHIAFFLKEAVLFPSSLKTFKASSLGPLKFGDFSKDGADNAHSLRVFAFNMGFYNLFVALGVAYSIFISSNHPAEGLAILGFLACVMTAAGIVLGLTASWLWPFALAQAIPAVICLLMLRGNQ